MRWFAHFMVGLITGTVAFIMVVIEENLTDYHSDTTQSMITKKGSFGFSSYGFYTLFALTSSLFAVLLTIYVGPGATGSGVAEIMGLLNGCHKHGVIGIRTFITKVFGVVLAVCGNLCVGKEGPLAHIGTIAALLVIYAPLKDFKIFQNDHDKR